MKSLEERKKLILRLMGEKSYKPMKEKELAILLEVKSEDREYLKEALNALLSEGTAVITKRGRYMLPEIRNITGIYRSTRHGYGFLELKDADEEDYFIEEGASMNAFDGDTVEAKPVNYGTSRGGRHKSAEICAVIKRAHETLVGTYDKSANRYGFVKPDNSRINRDIFIPLERSLNALDGQKVVCEIIDYGTERQSPEGRITEILGYVDEPGVDILSVIRGFDLPAEFPERVLNQANRVPDAVSESDLRGRRDLRGLLTVTIDGEDSKDLDDAVSLEMSGDDYLLGVHIADVANYVQEDSALDREALKRGTSVYLCDRVLPMLPQRLSNGICSLNENEDRLTLSCIMRINRNGEITDHEIVESVIRTRRRMTYTVVNELILKNDPLHGICEEVAGDKELVRMLSDMAELASILREKRKKRGSIDFGMPETKIELDENGYPTRIAPYDRNAATKLIEEFMLAANETVAEHYYWLKYPFVYRTHADPSADKMRSLAAFISKLGYGLHIKGDEIHPKELQKLLVKCEDTPEENLISRLTLRSMQRAVYSPQCSGHFGLACRFYCHFTSPIRRYPDLQIHRIIKDDLRGRLTEEKKLHYEELLNRICLQSSVRERAADEAEREIEKMKKAEYMLSRIGRVYEGIISGITSFGMYVELPNTVEGLVHVSRLDDYYIYDEDRYELTGERCGRSFVLGQSIMVKVDNVDIANREIDFVVA